jgi:hypothetical protein
MDGELKVFRGQKCCSACEKIAGRYVCTRGFTVKWLGEYLVLEPPLEDDVNVYDVLYIRGDGEGYLKVVYECHPFGHFLFNEVRADNRIDALVYDKTKYIELALSDSYFAYNNEAFIFLDKENFNRWGRCIDLAFSIERLFGVRFGENNVCDLDMSLLRQWQWNDKSQKLYEELEKLWKRVVKLKVLYGHWRTYCEAKYAGVWKLNCGGEVNFVISWFMHVDLVRCSKDCVICDRVAKLLSKAKGGLLSDKEEEELNNLAKRC